MKDSTTVRTTCPRDCYDACGIVVKLAADGSINVVGDPVPTDVIYTTLVDLYGGDPREIDWAADRARYQRVSRERMRVVLGLEPQIGLAEGLLEFIDWYRSDARRTA